MNFQVRIVLKTSAQQKQRLIELQREFAEVCNALAPLVQQTRCWNRVALHHMAYKSLRQRYPGLGSQLICNAIYSVSRSCRIVFQHPNSPFSIDRAGNKPLPRLHFQPLSPVYFDRHTLSIKNRQVSMFTLDGRLKFQLDLQPEDEQRFRDEKLREIVLSFESSEHYLTFTFAQPGDTATEGAESAGALLPELELPSYVVITADEALPPPPLDPGTFKASHA